MNTQNRSYIDLSDGIHTIQQETSCQEINFLWIIMAILFGFAFIKFLLFIIITIIKQCMPLGERLKKYCKQDGSSWAVVTGATDGIGLGFVEVLVSLGFNVVLISRNSKKLEKTIQDLQKIRPERYKQAKLKAITFNFQDSSNQEALNVMFNQLKDIDICLLVNNVGTSIIKKYHNIEPKEIIDIINTNCTSMAVITTYILKTMIKRTKKSGIINLSSFMNQKSIPYLILYAASKSFNKLFSNSLALQYPKLDILSLKPMFVESPLSQQKKGFNVPDRRQCAFDSLKELLVSSQSYGYYSHRVMAYIIRQFVPDFVYPLFVNSIMRKQVQKLFPKNQI